MEAYLSGRIQVVEHVVAYVKRLAGGDASIGQGPFGITQIHCMQVARGKLHVGSWPQGYVLRHEGDGKWTNVGRLGLPPGEREINEINDLTVHNGKLFLNYNKSVKTNWEKDIPGNVAKSDANWPKVLEKK